ncbi:MAG TPA: UbiH/UbiF/VisC/COQ6 family ubiquinone biosynthesis hydroxylase [Alphaproteobacteria bacterium]|nr:UbiH/UbiF/VisC/COQ6 family ubiquinone biosynthesis hydroxylase [Alphaproteobacteria bacterium]
MSGRFDVAVVGGGIAGATFAAILGDAGLKVALIERQPPAALEGSAYDGRTTAITYGSRKMLEAAGLWVGLAPHACPIDDIRVADNSSPLFLHFDSREVGDDPLGSIVENRLIRIALRERVDQIANVTQISPATVSGLDTEGETARVSLADGRIVTADLVIGADGRESFIRGAAGIKTIGWTYKQQAVVTIMGHELGHENVAVENFLPPGPFAMLPMVDAPDGAHRSSIVWTDHLEAVPLYMKLDKAAFDAELQKRAGDWLGKVWELGPRFAYPLSLRHATRYVARRVALIADAAHVIHPIAGQGLNLGMRDIGLLAELLIDQRRMGLDLGDPELLRRYEAKRRGDNFAFSAATDILDRLFSNDIPPIRAARRIGLGAVNRVPPLRRFFMRRAMGAAGALSRLGRGENV